jgi:hypothetical protein
MPFSTPVRSIRQIGERATMAYTSVQAALHDLQQRDMAHEVTGRQKERGYACCPVLGAIFRRG